MSRFLQYEFPATDTTAVCLTQTLAGAGSLALNGALSNSIDSEVNFLSRGYSRNVSLTSVNNLAAVNFTIIGVQNGVRVVDVIAGPNNDTVESIEVYDVVTSITTDNAVAAVSAGTGLQGFFLLGVNRERDIINYNFSTAQIAAAPLTTVIYGTLIDVPMSQVTLSENLVGDDFFEIKASSADNNYYDNDSILFASILIHIDGQPGEENNAIQVNFIQT